MEVTRRRLGLWMAALAFAVLVGSIIADGIDAVAFTLSSISAEYLVMLIVAILSGEVAVRVLGEGDDNGGGDS